MPVTAAHRETDVCRAAERQAIWSLGPRPKSLRSQSSHAPVSELTWYRRTGGDGVIVRFANRDGVQFKSP